MNLAKMPHSIREGFLTHFQIVQNSVADWAKAKGWWNPEENKGEKIALMHSELSEALEAERMGNPPDDKIPEFSGLEAELADTIIRMMHFAEQHNLRLAEAILAKMEYNWTRAFKHGKNF